MFFFLMIRRPPRSTRTDTLFPYTTLFRSLHRYLSFTAPSNAGRGTPRESIAKPYEASTDFKKSVGVKPRLRRNIAVKALFHWDGGTPRQRLVRDGSTLRTPRSEEHTSELQSLMRISYAVFCLKKKINQSQN